MAFVLKTWLDRVTEHPTRRRLDSAGIANTWDVVRDEGTITQEGDKINALNLNGFEARVKTGFDTLGNVTLACTKSTTVYALTGLVATDGLISCMFPAPAAYALGDTFTVNGTAYTISASSGTTLASGAFTNGKIVNVTLDATNHIISFDKLAYTAVDVGAIASIPANTLTGAQLNNSEFPYAYKTIISPPEATAMGLPSKSYFVEFIPFNVTQGFGVQKVQVLNGAVPNAQNAEYTRNSIGTTWNIWNGNHAASADYASGTIATTTAALRNELILEHRTDSVPTGLAVGTIVSWKDKA